MAQGREGRAEEGEHVSGGEAFDVGNRQALNVFDEHRGGGLTDSAAGAGEIGLADHVLLLDRQLQSHDVAAERVTHLMRVRRRWRVPAVEGLFAMVKDSVAGHCSPFVLSVGSRFSPPRETSFWQNRLFMEHIAAPVATIQDAVADSTDGGACGSWHEPNHSNSTAHEQEKPERPFFRGAGPIAVVFGTCPPPFPASALTRFPAFLT